MKRFETIVTKPIKLDKHIFDIDVPAYTEKLYDFIRDKKMELNRDGIIVPFSGGLDSSTVLLLCAKAVGAKNVTALLLPEKQGNPEALRYARFVTEQFQIRTITRNISPILARLGTYGFVFSVIPLRALQNWAAQKYLARASENPLLQIVNGKATAFQRKVFARLNTKHRTRAIVTYLVAEENNYLVAGCAHKSEDMLGLYVKFGVDDNADIMPLKNLYRSHILQIAAHLGVPDAILNRSSNPDIIPGVSDKYIDILGLPSETLDLIVYGVEYGLEDDDIASQLSLPIPKIRQIRTLILLTDHMRNPSQTLHWA